MTTEMKATPFEVDTALCQAVIDKGYARLLFGFLDDRPDLIPTVIGQMDPENDLLVVLFDRYFPDMLEEVAHG